MQALSISVGDGQLWGTQYHPELDLDVLGLMLEASADEIVQSGQAPDLASVERYADQISRVGDGSAKAELASKLEIGSDLAGARMRRTEVANYLKLLVRAQ